MLKADERERGEREGVAIPIRWAMLCTTTLTFNYRYCYKYVMWNGGPIVSHEKGLLYYGMNFHRSEYFCSREKFCYIMLVGYYILYEFEFLLDIRYPTFNASVSLGWHAKINCGSPKGFCFWKYIFISRCHPTKSMLLFSIFCDTVRFLFLSV